MSVEEISNKLYTLPHVDGIAKKDFDYELTFKVLTDSLVIPMSTFPRDCITLHDTSSFPHCFTMNSKFLIKFIRDYPFAQSKLFN